MGMSTYVVGIRPADERYKRMLAAYEACVAAGTEPPEAVQKFFNHEKPDPLGVVVGLDQFSRGVRGKREHDPCLREWVDDSCAGFEIDLDKVPDGIKILRFYNSW